MVSEAEIVDRAAEAATAHVLSHYDRSAVADLDVSVTFEDEQLSVDVLFETDSSAVTSLEEERRIADDATLAAADAVDRLIDERATDES